MRSPRVRGGFDKEHLSTSAPHRQARRHTWHRGARHHFVVELGLTQELAYSFWGYCNRERHTIARNLRGYLACRLAQFPLQVSHSRLACVVGHHFEYCRVTHIHFFFLQARLLDLARQE